MKTQNIQEKINKKKAELEILEKQLKEESDKSEYIYIKKLDIEIQTKIHHKGKSYDDLIKEFGKEYLEEHLPTYAQLQLLRNLAFKENKYVELGLLDSWEFVKQEDEISRKNGYVARFFAYSDYAYLDCDGYSCSSDSDLGVRFVRKKNKGKK